MKRNGPAAPVLPLRFAAVLVSLLLIIAILFSCLRLCINDSGFFREQYGRLQNAAGMGMSTEDLVRSTMQMIDYMENRVDSIDLEVTVNGGSVSMFNERERAHMVDVRDLYQGWRTASTVFFILYVLFAAFVLWRRQAGLRLSRAYLQANGLFLALLLVLGVWIALDFNSFWTAFHYLFFSNDLWLLDPAVDRMINMMPLDLFYAIVLRMAGWFVLVWGGLAVAAFFMSRRNRIKYGS